LLEDVAVESLTRHQVNRQALSTQRLSTALAAWMFILPALVLFVVFVVYPMIQSVYYSLFNWKGFGPLEDYVGFGNYQRILNDAAFLRTLSNGIVLVALSLILQLPLSLALALVVGRDLPGRRYFRLVLFMPYVFSEVIAAIMWVGLFNPDPDRGLFNAILVAMGVQPQTWLGNPQQVLGCIFAVLTWKYFGFHMLLYMAGLQNIPREVEEAALIDGAGGWQMLFFVTLPLLWGAIRTSVYLSILGALQQFGIIWVMTKGGPVNASDVMSTYMYRYSFVRFQLGYGSAVAIVMLIISLFFSIIYLRFVREQEYA
jgi:raffinose/stachyose/melibiose transport system permease protein